MTATLEELNALVREVRWVGFRICAHTGQWMIDIIENGGHVETVGRFQSSEAATKALLVRIKAEIMHRSETLLDQIEKSRKALSNEEKSLNELLKSLEMANAQLARASALEGDGSK